MTIGQAFGSATSAAISALTKGEDVGKAAGWDFGSSEGESRDEASPAPTETEAEEGQETASPEESTDSSEDAPEEEDVEELSLSDETGRKKVKINWKDKTQLKKYVEMAHGMRKFQAERDKAIKAEQALKTNFTSLEGKYKETSEAFNRLDQAWQKGGVSALVNLIAGNPKAYEEFEKQIVSKHDFLRSATPEQKKAYEIEEQLNAEKKEREILQKKYEDELKRIQETREANEAKEVENMVTPAFEKYRFQGKLGDPEVEKQLDHAIWTQALSNLERLPDEEISSAAIEREFRTVAATFSKVIGKQAKDTAKKVVESKKAQASEAVANAASKGMKESKGGHEAREKIVKGDLKGAFMDLLSGKKL
jgi:hypothetical protein